MYRHQLLGACRRLGFLGAEACASAATRARTREKERATAPTLKEREKRAIFPRIAAGC
jgi:hypothetical protein